MRKKFKILVELYSRIHQEACSRDLDDPIVFYPH